MRAKNLDQEKRQGKKNLMEKFGFSDDEEEELKLGGGQSGPIVGVSGIQ